MSAPERWDSATIGDGLTVLRLVIAGALIPIAWSLNLEVMSLLLSMAWLTDVLDGRLARAAGREGRMGKWDLPADTAVGAGLVIGLTGAGTFPVWLAMGVLIVLGGLFLRGNFAASMLLQLAGYVPAIGLLWSERPAGWWLPLITAVAVGVVDRGRLFRVNIPDFVRALKGRSNSR